MINECFIGDTRDGMRQMIADGVMVQCVVTSPPYFGLRDYGTALWEGGDAGCDHREPSRFDYALNSGLGPTGEQDQSSNAGSGSVRQFRVDSADHVQREQSGIAKRRYQSTDSGSYRVREVLERDRCKQERIA